MHDAKNAQARKASDVLVQRLGRALDVGRRKLCDSLALCREADPDGNPAELEFDP